ncbi:hypothetical protein RRG08_017071 [Elysia crispata]|uniref:Uncharacterized protein n=1 Tax=Elysia crispata TaxID=231223 RepID=A0AAE0ZV55_9GAST|nr:hypothetical protein RRG08_017071 [Elysia crispata]
MDKKDKDKNRNSFLDKVGGTFKVGGKTKKKSTSSAYNKGPQIDENDTVDPFTESVDFDSMEAAEVNERFEQLLDDMNLTEPKKAPLRSKDLKFRRQMLSMNSRGASKFEYELVPVTWYWLVPINTLVERRKMLTACPNGALQGLASSSEPKTLHSPV